MTNEVPLRPLIGAIGDAQFGLWMMVAAVIGAGAIYGLHFCKNSPQRFPKFSAPLWVALFFYYVGVLMYTPSSFDIGSLVGPSAYIMYAMMTVAAGCVLGFLSACTWFCAFKALNTLGVSLSKLKILGALILEGSKRQFDRMVLYYCRVHIPDEQVSAIRCKK